MTGSRSVLAGELAPLEPALAERYRFARELGRGGCGLVFLADDLKRGTKVAVKVLRLELGGSRAQERFAREIDIVTQLRHPNIVPVIESGEIGGTQYLVMPFIDGETLQQRLRRERQLSILEAAAIATQVADALEYAHHADVVHRDVKPANILLAQGRVLVADFGIARAISRTAPAQWQSSSRVQVGTAEYMSPEQAAGGEVDGRSDIYALGCTLYEMLAGAPPFTAATQSAVLSRHALDPVPSLRTVRQGVPPGVERVIMRALAKTAADRYPSAQEFSTALASAMAEQETAKAQGPTAHQRSRRAGVRAVAAVSVAAAVLASGLWYLRRLGPDVNRPKGFDPQLIAVAPFSVPDPDLVMWREGLVDVLSRSLDAAGPIRTVSPTLVFRQWSGRPDESSASNLGRRTGARYVVYGALLRSGRDSIRASAVVYDVAKSRSLGEVEVKEAAERVDRLADRLTVALLRELGQSGEAYLAEVRLAPAASTVSLPALKTFLQAEHFFRRTAWDSALFYYRRAVELDPRQPLALLRLSLVTRWQSLNGDSVSAAYALNADAVNRGLAPRESLMVHAGALFAKIARGFADTAYWANRTELFSTLHLATQRYSDERELWYALAEARYRADASAPLALDAYDRAIAIDSGFAPAYPNAVIMAMELGGAPVARRYLDAYLRLQPTDVHADGYRLAKSLLDATRVRDPLVQSVLDTASGELLANAADVVAYWPDSAESAVMLWRLLAGGRRTTVPALADTTLTSFLLAQYLAFRGHLREAVDVLGTQPTMLARVPGSQYVRASAVSALMLLGATSHSRAGEFFAQLANAPVSRPTGLVLALPWWSDSRDTVSLRRVIERGRVGLAAGKGGVEAPYLGYLTTAATAYLALARFDTTSALTHLLSLPDHGGCMYPYCPFERLVTARLLASRGDHTRAATLLDDVPNLYSPIAVLWRLERARVAERLGRTEVAVHEYQYVADAWARADSVFQPLVIEARSSAKRLAGGKSR